MSKKTASQPAKKKTPPAAKSATDKNGQTPGPPWRFKVLTERVRVKLPLATGDLIGFTSSHVEVQLQPSQAMALKRLFTALNKSDILLNNGQPIKSNSAALRWLLEQVAEQMDVEA